MGSFRGAEASSEAWRQGRDGLAAAPSAVALSPVAAPTTGRSLGRGATGGGCHGRWCRSVGPFGRPRGSRPRSLRGQRRTRPVREAVSLVAHGVDTNNPPLRRRFLGHFGDEFHQRCLAVAQGPVSLSTTLASHERVRAVHRAACSPRCARWRVSSSLAWTGSSTLWVAGMLGSLTGVEDRPCGPGERVRSGPLSAPAAVPSGSREVLSLKG